MTMFIKLPIHTGLSHIIIDLNKVLCFQKTNTTLICFELTNDIDKYATFNTEEERDEFYDKICNLIVTEI